MTLAQSYDDLLQDNATAATITESRRRIRDGAFGNYIDDAAILTCQETSLQRLREAHCLTQDNYESEAYRKTLGQDELLATSFQIHDSYQRDYLRFIDSSDLRGATVADIGCAGGSFLDHVRGLVATAYAVDPASMYHESLEERGYQAHAYVNELPDTAKETLDLMTSFHVIEHVEDPVQFLADMHPFLRQSGRVVITTPNLDDLLLSLLPEEYGAFFYRKAHRWYFNATNFAAIAELAGFTIANTHYLQRYSLSNSLLWLRDKKPSGDEQLPGMGTVPDAAWRAQLEDSGQAECVMFVLEKS